MFRLTLLILAGLLLPALSAETIKIADAIPGGEMAVKHLALTMVSPESELGFEVNKVSAQDALKQLEEKTADVILLPQDALPGNIAGTPYAILAVTVFVHTGNLLDNISAKDILKVYTALKPNWFDLNNSEADIHRYIVQDKNIRPLLGGDGVNFAKDIAQFGKTSEMLLMIAVNQNAIGLGRYRETLPLTIKQLPVNGVEPTKDNIVSGKYPLRSVRYAVAVTPAGEKLLQKFNTNQFQEILLDLDLIPGQTL